MAKSMGIEANEENNKALFSAFDSDKVNTVSDVRYRLISLDKAFPWASVVIER